MIMPALHNMAQSGADEIEISAILENLQQVLDFVDSTLDRTECSMKTRLQIAVAVEEVFVNIAHYAYEPGTGSAWIRTELTEAPPAIRIIFMDSGTPFDPMAKEDPDIKQSADERQIGGLGIFMTKKLMDSVEYRYKDGRNILTLVKGLQ